MMYWKKQQLRRMIAIGLVGGSFIAVHPVQASEELVGNGNVIIEAGQSYDKVIGGSIDQDLEDVKIAVKGDVKNNLSGGSSARIQDVAVKQITIAISDNANVESIQGGGIASNGHTSNVGNTEIRVSGNAIIKGMNGGGGSEGGNTHVDHVIIQVDSGIIGEQFSFGAPESRGISGGGYTYQGGKSSVDQAEIHINGGQVLGNIAGGGIAGENGEVVVKESTIAISGTKLDSVVVIGGGIADGKDSKTTGNKATISISDSYVSPEHHITGGNWVKNGGTGSLDMAIIQIDKSDVGRVSGAGFVENANAKVGEVVMNIKDSFVNNELRLGGAAVGGQLEIGTTNLTFEKSTLNGTLFGGGYASKLGDNGTEYEKGGKVVIDQSNIRLNNSQLNGDVYAGGWAQDDSKVLVKTSDIIIDNSVINGSVYAGGYNTGIGEANVENAVIHMSGGEIKGNILKGNAAHATLDFIQGTSGDSIVRGKISGFDSVTIKKNAKATLTGENVADEPVIQAKSLTIEEYGRLTIGKNMTIDLGGMETTFKLRAVRAAGGQLNLGGELLIPPGTTLELKNTNLISQGTGMVTVGIDSNGTVGKIGMTDSSFANNRLNLNIGLPLDQLEKKSAEEITKIIETAISKDLVENTNIENGKNASYSYNKDVNGNIQGVKANNSYLGFYTGIRQANAYIAQNMIGNIHERNASLRSGIKSNDFWVNIRGGSTEIDNGYGKAETKNQYYQLGYDWDISSDDNKAVIGLYFSKINGDTTQYNIKSDMENAYDLGIYGMKEFNGGNYLGLVGRYGNIKNNAKIDDREVKWQDKGYALSAEFGKRIQQKSGWMLEPYMQLTYNHLSEEGLNIDGNNHVSLEGTNLFDGRIGLRFIQQEKENPENRIYGGISYLKGISGQFKMKSPQGAINIEEDNDVNTVELSVGLNRQISKCSNINFNVKKEFGDYNGWGFQGSLNVRF